MDTASISSQKTTGPSLVWNASFREEMPSNTGDFQVTFGISATGQTAVKFIAAPNQQKEHTFSHLFKSPNQLFHLLFACRLRLKMQLRLCAQTMSELWELKAYLMVNWGKAYKGEKMGHHFSQALLQKEEIHDTQPGIWPTLFNLLQGWQFWHLCLELFLTSL